MKKRRAEFRPSILDILEDRAVPSSGGSSLHASSGGSGANSRLQTQLAQIGARVGAAYAEFAASVGQSELTLLSAGGAGAPTGTVSSVSVQVAQEVGTLSKAITWAVRGQVGGKALGLLQQGQLTGASPGSLSTGLALILEAASAGSSDGSVPQSSLPLLFTAIDGAIASSFNTTTVEIYLNATGLASGGGSKGPSGSTRSSFNLTHYENQVNAAYSTLSATVRQAETALISPGGPSDAVIVAALAGQQIETLARSIGGLAANTPVASNAAVIQGQFVGDTPAALSTQLASLLVASAAGSSDGSVPQSSLPLLFTAVDAAINASSNSTAIEGVLLASESSSGSGLNGGGATPTDFSSYGDFFAR